jgi:hypothetical protein
VVLEVPTTLFFSASPESLSSLAAAFLIVFSFGENDSTPFIPSDFLLVNPNSLPSSSGEQCRGKNSLSHQHLEDE